VRRIRRGLRQILARAELFDGAHSEEVPAALRRFEFHSSERACLLDTLLETDAGVELGECYKNTDLERVFLLHDEAERLELEALLGEGSMVRTDPLPLRHIEAYLGPEYAFYFAFLFRLTRAFWLPATLGVVLFAVKQDFGGSGSDADWLTPAYALLLMVWATAFVETWKRSENTLMLDWDLDARLPRPHVRHEFECEFRRGIHSQSDEFVGIAEEELPASAQAPLTEMTEASLPRRRSCYSCAVLSLFLGATIIGTLGLVVLRFIATELGGVGGTFDAALAMALFVEAMSYVYDKAAYMLTGWENHRTYATYRDSLILKLFTYSFINKTGFGKGRTARLFGRSYVEPCLDWAGNETDSCMDELRTQVLVLIVCTPPSRSSARSSYRGTQRARRGRRRCNARARADRARRAQCGSCGSWRPRLSSPSTTSSSSQSQIL